ncbi:alpha/beta fold hydrolase [Corynebacterium sp. J010B-136]|nr:alpha/beta hydrolase [Corynebacterium sp. J010B-136]PQM75220.1 alpha/beta hydrolase [Corynebacterium sp. J010B-136]
MYKRNRIAAGLRGQRRKSRSAQRLVHQRLHDHETSPGLRNLDAEGKVDNDGVDIAWFEVGNANADVTVVFIHGYCLSSEAWCDQVEHLRSRTDVRSLLVDVRGHGLSSRVPARSCTIDGAADDVLAVISERLPKDGGRIVVVGHSLGGMIALNLIRRAPQEIFERISGALLISTSMRRFSDKGITRILQSKLAKALYSAIDRVPDKFNRIRFAVAQVLAPTIAALVAGFPQMERLQFHTAMLLDTPLASFVGYFDDLTEHEEFAAQERLQKLHGQAVIGSMDIVTPMSQSELICTKWGKGDLKVIDGSGHMVILEEPEQISQALDEVIAEVSPRLS